MNKKKRDEKRKKRGLLSFDEHMKRREERMLNQYRKNKKNKGKSPFN